ncbi:MAG: DinB family protein [Phycisphaerales bacterium]|nr:DinB family protein [Planctomycetota bacterium]
MDRTIIDSYAAQADELKSWIAGLTRDQLNAHPVPGTWSIAQCVFHVLDSDLVATDRIKRISCMDLPLLMNYDESRYAALLFYDKRDPGRACELFAANRRHTAELLTLLPDEALERQGVHSVRGLITLASIITGYVGHVIHHRGFVVAKRVALGKPLTA